MNKIIDLSTVLNNLADDQTVMIGGFGTIGTPEKIIDGLVESNKKNLTLIANDTGLIGKGIGKLIVNKQVKKAIVSHVGTNPETGRQMINGEIV